MHQPMSHVQIDTSLVPMGARAEGLACADTGTRAPIANGNFCNLLFILNLYFEILVTWFNTNYVYMSSLTVSLAQPILPDLPNIG